jgi:hypothetical protein
MKTVRFHFQGRGIDSEVNELVEFEDNITDYEISKIFVDWLYERSHAGWEKI